MKRWDAATYHQIDTPMRRWAESLLGEMMWRGDEVVLDAGCGSGVVTELLARRVPCGRVYAVDASSEMIHHLRAHVATEHLDHVVPFEGDLTNVSPIEPCDVIFSNAVFHWIADFDALAANLASWARPGARLRAQCGGIGNVERMHAAAAVPGYALPAQEHVWFRTPDEATRVLEANGWTNVRAWLADAPTPLGDRAATIEYLGAVILRVYAAAQPDEATRARYLGAVYESYIARFGEPFVADYVRLNLSATRSAE